MSFVNRSSGLALALAAAGMVGCASYQQESAETSAATTSADMVHCYGVNKCAGHNDCKTASNACKGHGSCKGKGFVSMSAKACGDVGGSVGS